MKALRLEKGDAAFYRHEDMVVAKYTAKKDQMGSQRRCTFLAHSTCSCHRTYK